MSEICFICENSKFCNEKLTNCTYEYFKRIKDFTKLWSALGRYATLNEKISTSTWSAEIYYHSKCYGALTHKNNLKKLQNAQEYIQKSNNPQKSDDLTLCVICQEIERVDQTSKISTIRVAQEILNLKITTSTDVQLQNRLSSLTDPLNVISKEIRYHPKCLNKKKSLLKENYKEIEEKNKYEKINNDYLTRIKQQFTSDENCVTVDVNQLVKQYDELIDAANLPRPVTSMRPYVKDIVQSDQKLMSQIDFYHSEPSKPSVVAKKLLASKLVCDKHYYEGDEDENDLLKAAKVVRRELNSLKPWEFNGTFDNFEIPPKLNKLIKLIIADNKTLNERKQTEIDSICSNVTQYIYSNFKSDRQLTYKSVKDRGFEKHRITPLSVGTALISYKNNKSKLDLESMTKIGLCINYDKLQRIITGIAMTSIEQASMNPFGIVLPPCFKKGIRPVFAADNIDLGSDASSFHGADLMIVQKKIPNGESLFPEMQFQTKCQSRSLKVSIAPEIDENVELTTENDSKYKTPISIKTSSDYWQHFHRINLIWLFLSNSKFVASPANETIQISDEAAHDSNHLEEVDELENDLFGIIDNHQSEKSCKALSWSAFHSIISEPPDSLSNVAIVAPLYRRSPTEVPILLDILKRAMNISALIVGKDKKTIITLDGDLYARAVKIPNYKSQWIIRLGSLHTIIAALKCLGKYIHGSGLDTGWEESGIYGSATVNQIIEGRHIYRGIQAHTMTLIALQYLHAQHVLNDDEKRVVTDSISKLEKEISDDIKNDAFVSTLLNVQQEFIANSIFEKLDLKKNCENTGPTGTFLYNYTTQVMNLLHYTEATRNRDWKLHLSTAEEMCKYFHAHDQINYLKWELLYLADMLELETSDVEAWDFLAAGNFAVSKNEVPFTSIDPDHAIEHEHRPMKMKGGFSRITGNDSALERFALLMPILSNIAQNGERYLSIKPSYPKQAIHPELIGRAFENRLKQSQNLVYVLSREGNPFEYSDLRNLMNFAVPNESICKDVLERDQLGLQSLQIFRKERMTENSKVPFWDPFSKNNFKMFSDKEIVVSNSTKVVTSMRKERQLYARLLLITRSRPQLCPEKVIGEYEFTHIPPSNFLPDGAIITAKKNFDLIKLIQARPQSNTVRELSNNEDSVIITNGMYMLDLIKKKPMKNVTDLVKHFLSELQKISDKHSEIRLIFEPFVAESLATGEKQKVRKTVPVHYHIKNNTPIKSFDNFIAHYNTRKELAMFLAEKALELFKDSHIKFLTNYENNFVANCPLAEICSDLITGKHNLKKINQLILLNVIDTANKNRSRNLIIETVGTDIVVLLIGHYTFIPLSTTIISSGLKIRIDDLYYRLGQKLADSLIGWYAFQGMDDEGAFFGKGVTTQFQTFVKSDDNVLHAFSNFGTTIEISDHIIAQIERYICLLYGKSYERNIKDGKDGNQLPPTLATLIPHTSRAYYQALISKMSVKSCPNIPPPTNYHWNVTSDNRYEPIMCLNPPSPIALTELKKCGCKSNTNRCKRLLCTCFKNGLQCCDLCGCGDGCQNTTREIEKLNEEDFIL